MSDECGKYGCRLHRDDVSEVRALLRKARERVRPTVESRGQVAGAPGNWLAPFHKCKCGRSLNWRERGLHIVGTCDGDRCRAYFSYALANREGAQ